MEDRHPQLRSALRHVVLDGPATADAGLRRAAYRADGLAEPLNGYLDKLRRHAYRVQDSDIEALHRAGHSDDQIFELTVAAALGAGDTRLRAGLTALNEVLR
ncbi:hypothetical protein H7H78_16955 [Mycobacterium shinjukuense]|uniref:Uncharacterized protein n=1 Tax=Mycobacterium shinjukuense TaxID=398694 RepID=A0A7I7MUD8_9MYCO|nr:hypothetical protein [Mycobacterium shinjukuense]MCV6987043.1 hypothetical protein [Mycobacterium shinjukuense]ORB68082.1 hypothetical protein BST45_12110 [Mycobacterium shinjukuense]BBX75765.1 hypothetical protein MSHI_36710 [Mycobacterium shinjukuense]